MNKLQHNIKLGSSGISSLLGGFSEHEKNQSKKLVQDWLTSISTEKLGCILLAACYSTSSLYINLKPDL